MEGGVGDGEGRGGQEIATGVQWEVVSSWPLLLLSSKPQSLQAGIPAGDDEGRGESACIGHPLFPWKHPIVTSQSNTDG